MEISDETNDQVNLCAKQKFEVLSATKTYKCREIIWIKNSFLKL